LAVRSALVRRALATGQRAAALRRAGRRPGPLLRAKLALANRVVWSRVRDRFGGQLRFGVSGGAALPPAVAELFDVIGIAVLEGYGLSEATCASHFNRPGRQRPGTVGPPLPGVGCRLAGDGEILLAGETVFAGYLDDAEATAAVLGDDGWLRTGDVGEVDADGYLRIIDRKKDLIVTSGGKNISPQKLEQALAADPLVSQALVVGDGRPYLVALIAPDLAEVQRLDLDRTQLELRIAESVKRLNGEVGKAERIARHRVLDREFSQDAGEITATLKLRRRSCAERFAVEIDQLYADRLAGA
jgi:long-chain acyl-CoA synthetase